MKGRIKTEHLLTGAIILFILVIIAPYFNVTGSSVKEVSCSDSDSGEDFYTPGEVTVSYEHESRSEVWTYADRCMDEDNVQEYFCFENEIKKTQYRCPYGCSHNACVYSGCTDSDGGKDYYTSGIAVFEGKTDEIRKDYCLNANTLNEYFCASQEEIRAVEYVCTYGCSNGVCLSSSAGKQICEDTDGKDYFRKGRITNPNGKIQEDLCVGILLIEYYCTDEGLAMSSYYICPNGCSDGECIAY